MTAGINCLAQDRAELMLSSKEACRSMATPTTAAMKRVKHIGIYLRRVPRVRQFFAMQEMPTVLEAITDSDWAGCRRTRKSTSGGLIRFGSHVVRAWSSTQSVISLSSGEAEYYAALKGMSVAMGVRTMLEDMGVFPEISLGTDSSAAKGMASRRGLGKTRHVEVCYLWLQGVVARGDARIVKIPGLENPADLMTKFLSGERVTDLMKRMSLIEASGRRPMAPACAGEGREL